MEKVNMTAVAAQPICTIAGSPCENEGTNVKISKQTLAIK
jgi:hypothetical protein